MPESKLDQQSWAFKPYDFGLKELNNTHQLINIEDAAKVANAKLKEWLDEAPEIEVLCLDYGDGVNHYVWNGEDCPSHVAKLVNIEVLPDGK